MSSEALKAAEAALAAAIAAEKTAPETIETAAPVTAPSTGSVPTAAAEEAGSVYLGHIGEPAVEGKDF